MPQFIFVAGCNAAGKSTFIRTKLGILEGFQIFMTDVYKNRTKEMVLEAIKNNVNIILETVFNDSSFVELANVANSSGYSTSLIVLFLDSIDQSLQRVALRAKNQTGLLISDGNVKLNFNESFKNISQYYFYFNRVDFIYTGINSMNQFIMSFSHDKLEEYHSNQLNYVKQFANYGLSRGRLDQFAYNVISKNEDYQSDY